MPREDCAPARFPIATQLRVAQSVRADSAPTSAKSRTFGPYLVSKLSYERIGFWVWKGSPKSGKECRSTNWREPCPDPSGFVGLHCNGRQPRSSR